MKSQFCSKSYRKLFIIFLTIMTTLIKSLDFSIFANSYQKNIKKTSIFFLQSIYFVLVFFMVFSFFHETYRHTSATSLFQCFFAVFVNIPLRHNSPYQIFIKEKLHFVQLLIKINISKWRRCNLIRKGQQSA